MSAPDLSRLDELLSRHLDDALTDSDTSELLALLAEPASAARFLEMTRLNSEIAGLLAAPVPDAAMVELVRADLEQHAAKAPPPRAGVKGRRMLAWAATFLALAGLAAFFLFHRAQPADAPVIASLSGDVRWVGAGGERGPTVGDSWQPDEKLKTSGARSAVAVKFHDGSQLDFGGNTVAAQASSEEGLRVQLDRGAVQASLRPQPAGHPFVLATPEAEAIVVGTTLRLVAGGHHTRLEVTEGEARFRRRHDGAEVAVRAGHYAVVAPNAPLVATPFHPDPHAVH